MVEENRELRCSIVKRTFQQSHVRWSQCFFSGPGRVSRWIRHPPHSLEWHSPAWLEICLLWVLLALGKKGTLQKQSPSSKEGGAFFKPIGDY
ncbi:hypothetical protein XELAEV_18045573mg [Xenopus laevis]|uniref:Uncharacterized protein n=1 Tax=Xenopus laevis TaxID=8355 RepID=A0A974H4E5_XENLA|nr:hypothetical protein XELAEV_18045573mg [Xenopus laevis]